MKSGSKGLWVMLLLLGHESKKEAAYSHGGHALWPREKQKPEMDMSVSMPAAVPNNNLSRFCGVTIQLGFFFFFFCGKMDFASLFSVCVCSLCVRGAHLQQLGGLTRSLQKVPQSSINFFSLLLLCLLLSLSHYHRSLVHVQNRATSSNPNPT